MYNVHVSLNFSFVQILITAWGGVWERKRILRYNLKYKHCCCSLGLEGNLINKHLNNNPNTHSTKQIDSVKMRPSLIALSHLCMAIYCDSLISEVNQVIVFEKKGSAHDEASGGSYRSGKGDYMDCRQQLSHDAVSTRKKEPVNSENVRYVRYLHISWLLSGHTSNKTKKMKVHHQSP